MQVGIETISWGTRVADVGKMLREVKEAGYTGVEFAQHPDELGPVNELYPTLSTLDLRCIGIAGGSLQEKIDFVRNYNAAERVSLVQTRAAKSGGLKWLPDSSAGDNQPFIYVDEWEGQSSIDALRIGMTLALHPHMFKGIQTSADAEMYLGKYARLQFLPDTAHLTVAGQDVVKVIDRNYERIQAIHLKDWTAEFGRAYQFYSRGFVELGQGDVLLEEVIRFLKQRNYKRWIVVEQDVTPDPFQSALASRQWLRDHGI
jgi:sugar phosphate isomerase/epimerase